MQVGIIRPCPSFGSAEEEAATLHFQGIGALELQRRIARLMASLRIVDRPAFPFGGTAAITDQQQHTLETATAQIGIGVVDIGLSGIGAQLPGIDQFTADRIPALLDQNTAVEQTG